MHKYHWVIQEICFKIARNLNKLMIIYWQHHLCIKNLYKIVLSSRHAVITCLLHRFGGNPVENKNIYRFMHKHPEQI